MEMICCKGKEARKMRLLVYWLWRMKALCASIAEGMRRDGYEADACQDGLEALKLCGVGLALVRDIAAQHGGSVKIAHSSDEGTEMLLTLPTSGSSG